ncbi:pirin family protein [uncultured Fluviicola sp.]|uniref:pirin family protein n=1 Tax=uncultured Fluviicola sp. TaxID=463303 RepID=UPI0025E1A012|nr:pirin family protein [uncultured Fluviicola sp.]
MSKEVTRRNFVQRLSAASAGLFALPWLASGKGAVEPTIEKNMNAVKRFFPLGFQWETQDPFLFCVHHEDQFPKGNEQMGPDPEYFKGRHMGDDFIIKDGFRMYHGKKVPGFPGHPHRGFETITVVRRGLVDHADSLGAAGRYGNGDVQWMTAGKGVQHSEMFPLMSQSEENPLELFQVWLNLPKKNKMVEPHFKMLWRESIPNLKLDHGKVLVELIAGNWGEDKAMSPPPDSWAFPAENEVLIVNIKMEPHAKITLPKAPADVNRSLFFYEGDQLSINEESFESYSGFFLDPTVETHLSSNDTPVSLFLLQGKPINEQVMQYGPFVMNTKEEIKQAFDDYHQTQFGGWPWPKYDQVHDRNKTRFALHADGREEIKDV